MASPVPDCVHCAKLNVSTRKMVCYTLVKVRHCRDVGVIFALLLAQGCSVKARGVKAAVTSRFYAIT